MRQNLACAWATDCDSTVEVDCLVCTRPKVLITLVSSLRCSIFQFSHNYSLGISIEYYEAKVQSSNYGPIHWLLRQYMHKDERFISRYSDSKYSESKFINILPGIGYRYRNSTQAQHIHLHIYRYQYCTQAVSLHLFLFFPELGPRGS